MTLFLTLCGLLEDSPLNPTSVVFFVQSIARELRTLLLAIELIIHAVEGQWLDFRAGGDVKIGILVPAIHVKEKFADTPDRLRWQRACREFQCQFISAIQQSESFIARGNQLRDIAVARTPSARSDGPI